MSGLLMIVEAVNKESEDGARDWQREGTGQ